ncbi:AAA family ATPase [Roseomonas hellenica]|uniref:AAA family ATPase n=1 Tax=Plastoroseomonas hellenica TaxID=2687306 RepID=A0ABS5EYQ0_9PROT|nr:AAA family ATPase [Plastoroseomonas hellenica]MBR0665432.1 AAA family ATPase [Plastoroseomonas hellenica]
MSGFQLRGLRVTGPGKVDAEIKFAPGLNVISGPSDTGKSYIVETIDFMLGSATSPRQIPESLGYDQAHLAIKALDGRCFTLTRALQGGDFLLADSANPGAEPTKLSARHSATDADNISTFLLRLIDLDQKRLRKNANNELQNLSFRNLAPLILVDEESIIKKSSPVFTGEATQRTVQASLFKLLLTGVDDGSLIAVKKRTIAKAEIEAQIALLDQLIVDYEDDLKALIADPSDLADQEARLEAAIATSEQALSVERSAFEVQAAARREAWTARERIDLRRAEIEGLNERFALLDQSYGSDLERLEAVAEAGQFFVALAAGPCPLCGAPAGGHTHEGIPHDGDIEKLRTACKAEIAKIRQLRLELAETVADLTGELAALQANAVIARTSFDAADALLRETLAPALSVARAEHTELLETRAQVREARSLVDRTEALRGRRAEAEAALGTAGRATDERPGLPAASVKAFSDSVETLLTAWRFPHEKPVYFDERDQDMVLGSRRRGDQGKGLRALTHAAFTLGLQLAIATLGRSSVGFAVLDSPLVTFREADHDDELASDQKVAVKQAFYSDLATRLAASQLIVLENEDPEPALRPRIVMHFFSKQHTQGRYGFFPVTASPARRTPV